MCELLYFVQYLMDCFMARYQNRGDHLRERIKILFSALLKIAYVKRMSSFTLNSEQLVIKYVVTLLKFMLNIISQQ